jgi:hypothetical protein
MENLIVKLLNKNIVEHSLFLLLGIFAYLLFEERLYADSSYYIFRVVNNQNFYFEHNRFILILSQIIALVAVKTGMGLKTVLCLYSIGHVAFFYAIFLITRYYYKDEKAGIFLLFIQTLGIISGFFVPMFELYYSAGLLVLFISILYNSNIRKTIIILLILSFFILTAHSFSFVLFVFVLAMHAAEYKLKFIRTYILFFFITIVIFIFKTYTASEYDQAKSNAFIYTLRNGIYNLKYLESLCVFLFKYYKELLLIEIITIIILIFSRDFVKAAIIGLAFLGTLAIINISIYGFDHTRYQEQVYFPLSFLSAFPFVYYALKNKSTSLRISFSLLAFIIIIGRINGIWAESKIFTKRTEEMKSLIEGARTRPGSKFIVSENNLKFAPNWSYPIETMLLSSYDSNQKTITICTDVDFNFNQNSTRLLPGNYLFRRWEIYNISTLNKNYFYLECSPYKMLK